MNLFDGGYPMKEDHIDPDVYEEPRKKQETKMLQKPKPVNRVIARKDVGTITAVLVTATSQIAYNGIKSQLSSFCEMYDRGNMCFVILVNDLFYDVDDIIEYINSYNQ